MRQGAFFFVLFFGLFRRTRALALVDMPNFKRTTRKPRTRKHKVRARTPKICARNAEGGVAAATDAERKFLQPVFGNDQVMTNLDPSAYLLLSHYILTSAKQDAWLPFFKGR